MPDHNSEQLELIINADDFGVSPGVNQAIVAAFRSGVLNSTSIIMNAPHADEAVRLAGENPYLRVGVHLNLTRQRNQSPLADPAAIPLLIDADGKLRHGFVGLLGLSLRKNAELERQAKIEMRAQIEKAVVAGIKPSHLDSHRHIHAIPALYRAVRDLAAEYRIPRVRVVNESFSHTWRGAGAARSVLTGGLVKYLVLRTLFGLNGADGDTYFYSILHTMRLYGGNMRKILVPRRYQAIEIGIHPSIVAKDRETGDPHLADYDLLSPDRQREFETLLDKELPARIARR